MRLFSIRAQSLGEARTDYKVVVDDGGPPLAFAVEVVRGIDVWTRGDADARVGSGRAGLLNRLVAEAHVGEVVRLPVELPE